MSARADGWAKQALREMPSTMPSRPLPANISSVFVISECAHIWWSPVMAMYMTFLLMASPVGEFRSVSAGLVK